MTVVVVVTAVVALLAGLLIGWLMASARISAANSRLLAARDASVQGELRAAAGHSERAGAERDLAKHERERTEVALVELRRLLDDAQQARVAAETKLIEAERLILDKNNFIETSKKQLEDSFAALAQRTLKTVSEQMLVLGRTQLDGSKGEMVQSLDTKRVEIEALLGPLREMVEGYRGEVTKSEQVRTEIYGGLQEQIRQLLSVQESAQREASRLATALTSPTVRGSWGEITLRRCVELAGMSEFCDFSSQESFSLDEGRRIRPDLIVRLPNDRVIALDAKAPASDYQAASEASDEATRRDLLLSHAKNLRRHIDSLSRKEYQSAIGESLDFTVMFLPAEHLLSAALVTDPLLFEYAVEKKIYLATPTVLLPLLRAINAGWKAEKTEENAKKMHDGAVDLFNRFVIVMEHIASIGDQLRRTVESYNKAMRSIDTRLWPKGEELQRMTGSGRELGELKQLELTPMESSKLRLTSQSEEGGDVVKIRD